MSDEIHMTESDEYLTFSIGEETFAFEIIKVCEVLYYMPITEIPRMPEYLLGVINMRGDVVPVIDLRRILGLDSKIKADKCVIIAVESEHEGDIFRIGVLADSVETVHNFSLYKIFPPSAFGMKIDSNFVIGTVKLNDDFAVILDIEKILSALEQERGSDIASHD